MNFTKKSLRLYAVTDRSWLHGETLYEQVEKALKGGVTLVQLREKELSEADFEQEAKEPAPKKMQNRWIMHFYRRSART